MLEKKGKKQKANLFKELFNGMTNYRIWLLAACYAYSFGVEVRVLALMPANQQYMSHVPFSPLIKCQVCLSCASMVVACTPILPVSLDDIEALNEQQPLMSFLLTWTVPHMIAMEQ